MRLIHCADLHLNSSMTRHLDPDRAKERRNEILNTYLRMVDYASNHQIDAILIAGDLFDTRNILAGTRNAVLSSIRNHPDIAFFYLKGNHDNTNFLSDSDAQPENLMTFSDSWTAYRLGSVVIRGIELTIANSGSLYHELQPTREDFNIVMLHGQLARNIANDGTTLSLPSLRNKGIDYLALGHVHKYQAETLDARGTYCYPGCLEGRGYDECGTHGFVVLDIDETTHTYTHTFVPFASRTLHTVPVDVTDSESATDMIASARQAAGRMNCREQDMVQFDLVGDVDVEAELNPGLLVPCFRDAYYHVKVSDHTRMRIDPDRYRLDESLKGEFVRTILADPTIPESDKTTVIRYGLQAIAGEVF